MMHSQKIALLGTGLLFSFTLMTWAKDELPSEQKFARYEPMLKRSPFAVATAGAAPTTADFAKDLYVANAAHSTDGDYVTLASTTDKNFKEYLSTKETTHGFSVSNIQWSDQVGETKVTVGKDGQFATLTFNEALLSQAIQNPAPQTAQQQQANSIRPAGNPQAVIQRPMAVPQIPTPPPHVRPVIRRKANPQASVPQPAQSQQPDSDEDSELDNP